MTRWHLWAVLLFVACAAAHAVQRQTVTHTAAGDFQSGRFERTVVRSDGKVMLSRKVDQVLAAGGEALFVTALAEDTAGAVYAATGPKGMIYRRLKGAQAFEPWYSGPEKLINCLYVDAADRLYAGTSGKQGRLLRILEKDRADELFADPDVQHVWAVAGDGRGNLYLATGAAGKLFKLAENGRKDVLITAEKDKNFTALAVTAEGVVYAGTDTNGLIFRVAPTGEVFCLHDAPQAEISVLALDAKGNLLAATATANAEDEGDHEDRDRALSIFGVDLFGEDEGPFHADGGSPSGSRPADDPDAEKLNGPSSTRPGDASGPDGEGERPSGPSEPGGEEGNALYRISEEGFVTLLLAQEAPILSLAQEDDRILVGTGDGVVIELSDDGRRTAPIIKLEDARQITDILRTAVTGQVLLAAAETGGVYLASAGYAEQGTFTSEVIDAKQVSRFGRLSWRAVVPANATISLATRTGNLEEPGANWSDWSDELLDPEAGRVLSPPARFIQYRVTFSSMNAAASAVLDEVELTFVARNQPPVVNRIERDGAEAKDAPAAGPPASTEGKGNTVKWDASDPNGDSLLFDLAFRQVGQSVWIPLETGYEKSEYAWATGDLPDGRFEFRVIARDTPDNTTEEAASAELVSDPLLVDNTAPTIRDLLYKWQADGSLRVEATCADVGSVITAARFTVDAKDGWRPAAALDELFDFPTEKIAFTVKDLSRGPHYVMIRASDEAGNTATAALTIQPPGD